VHYDPRDGFGSVGVPPFCQKIIMMGHYLQHLADGRKAQAEQWTRTPSPARLELGSKVSISMPG
jgi:hypothetical protein